MPNIDQVKTISDLERIANLEDSYALAVSTGAATNSATCLQMATYLKAYLQAYLQAVENRVNVVNSSSDTTHYPSAKAVWDFGNYKIQLVNKAGSDLNVLYCIPEN